MSLVAINQADVSDIHKLALVIRGVQAIDTQNFAFLRESGGYGRGGLEKYFLSVPVNISPLSEVVKMGHKSGPVVRSVIRAYSLDDALEIANKRLPKLLDKARGNKEAADA